MDLAGRMHEARRRQAQRGRLRWLLDDFCRRDLSVPLRPGELLDLADDVRAFANADDEPVPSEDDLREIQQETIGGLRALFKPGGYRVGAETVLEPRDAPGDEKLKPRRGTIVDGMFTRLWLPLALKYRAPAKDARMIPAPTLSRRFRFAAASAMEAEWRALGRCPRCWNFFYVVRRQVFCSPRCKQAAMDERKGRRRRRGVSIEPLLGHEPVDGLPRLAKSVPAVVPTGTQNRPRISQRQPKRKTKTPR